MKELVFYGVGDVAPHRADPNEMFKYVAPLFRSGDFVFGNLEENLSNRGASMPHAGLPMRTDPKVAKAIKAAGFHAVSYANNHCMDWGRDALIDTLKHVRGEGIAITGSGETIAEARVPAIVERDGVKMAFVAANSILPMGYWAEERRAGCVPMRAYTHYEQIEHDQPGTPCRIHTFPHAGDLAALVADVRAAKSKADIVVLSIHWGIHFIPEQIADYQRTVAHAVIDAGCDLVLGHHPHILKAVEVYKGKAIFHSLANFAIEFPTAWSTLKWEDRPRSKEISKLNPGIGRSKDLLFPDDMLKTGIVKCVIAGKAIKRVSFLPCMITKTGEPELLKSADARFGEIAGYLEKITQNQGLETRFSGDGDELVIAT
jgi:poly-gamma-glutamate synthesis protein (capsule biosynthesis protein)